MKIAWNGFYDINNYIPADRNNNKHQCITSHMLLIDDVTIWIKSEINISVNWF